MAITICIRFYTAGFKSNEPQVCSILKKGPIQALIHDLKYRGNKELSFYLGSWLGEILLEAGWQRSIDVVIPVPLHRQRMRERGYNQVEGFWKSYCRKAFGKVYRYPLKKTLQFQNSGIQKPNGKV